MNQAEQAFADPTQILDRQTQERPSGLIFPTDKDALLEDGSPRVGLDDPNKGGMYRRLNLTEEEKSYVVYPKYEALSTDISDTVHDRDYPWVEQFTATPGWLQEVSARLSVFTGDGYQMLDVDHSYVVTFHGRYSGEYGIAQDGTVMTRSEAEDRMMSTGRRNIPLFSKWEFRVVEAVMTDGFEARRRLVESAEAKVKEEQASTFTALKDMFKQLVPKKEGEENIDDVQQGIPHGADLAAALAAMEPEQLAAAVEMADDIRTDADLEKKTTRSKAK